MVYFYLTKNINRNEPDAIRSCSYIHVKAKNDGSQTIIISEENINDQNILLKTKEEAQLVLDSWINDENLNPTTYIDRKPVLQQKINLGIYLG